MAGIVTDIYNSTPYDYAVTFSNYSGKEDYWNYNDCDLELASSHAEPAEPEMAEVTIKVPAISADKIPAGMKLGNPAYEYRLVKKGEWFFDESISKWMQAVRDVGCSYPVANFVPCKPVEEFVDKEVEPDADNMYSVETPARSKRLVSNISSHTLFDTYLWKDTDGGEIYRSLQFFRHEKFGICTHVRFSNSNKKRE